MPYTNYVKLRILHFYNQGLKPYTIAKVLDSEGIQVSHFGVHKFLIMYQETGSVERRPGSGCMSKVSNRVRELVDEQMQRDDESMAYQLHQMLIENGVVISLHTILRCQTTLGWTFRGSASCQLIRDENKGKRLEWCQQNIEDTFDNVIWMDESSV